MHYYNDVNVWLWYYQITVTVSTEEKRKRSLRLAKWTRKNDDSGPKTQLSDSGPVDDETLAEIKKNLVSSIMDGIKVEEKTKAKKKSDVFKKLRQGSCWKDRIKETADVNWGLNTDDDSCVFTRRS